MVRGDCTKKPMRAHAEFAVDDFTVRVTATDRVIRWTTAAAVIGAARSRQWRRMSTRTPWCGRGEAGWTARLVPGLTVW